jgi:protein subunit release factor A
MALEPTDIRIVCYTAGDSSSCQAVHLPTGYAVTWATAKGDGRSPSKVRAKALDDLAALVEAAPEKTQ